MEKLNNKFIEVSLSTRSEFVNFMSHNFLNSAPNYNKDNMPAITKEKRSSTLMCSGLPFTVTKQ